MLKYFLKIKSEKIYADWSKRPSVTIDKWYELSTEDRGETGTIVDDKGDNLYGYGLISGCLSSYWEVKVVEEESEEYKVLVSSIQEKKPSPRYHKPRKRPPVRKKTDVVFYYENGKRYTLKNVSYIFALHGDYVKVEYKEKGIEKTVKLNWKNNPFSLRVKSPNMTTSLYYGKEDFEGEVMFLDTGKELSFSGDNYEQNF